MDAGRDHRLERLLAAPAERVEARVDDQADRAERLAVQHPEALGLAPEEAGLVRHELRVERPALHVRGPLGPEAQGPEGRQVLELHLERELEVVARHGLVVRRRRGRPVGPAGQVVRVHEVDPVPRAIRGRRVVVRAGGVLLQQRVDRADLAARLRGPREPGGCDVEGPLDVLRAALHERGGRRRDLGRVGVQRGAVGGRVIAEAGGPGDDPARGLDRLELLEPDPVELLRGDVEARVGPNAGRVALGAARRGAQAGDVAGGRQVGAHGLEIAGVGRPDVPLHGLEDPRPVLLPGDRREGHDRRRLGRAGQEALQLVNRPFGDHAGRGQAGRSSLVHEADHGLRHGRVCGQAGEQPLQALRRVRLLELDELGQERLVALLLDGPDEIHPGLVVRDLRGRGEARRSRVMRSSSSSEATGIAAAAASVSSARARRAARPTGPGSSRRSS